ncbi:hypothetical protein GCM10008022_09310 [Paenibacillus hunanensis]|uniref:Mn-containing catalase n=1 Tax=Paenibacillus hunanensis TaxID=539262 RepID=A0ABU1IU17_9BACL|nr:Mn-containing catalase [Paenibacillus hunanensis]GGJ02454.1 hypothetical protein GCM10008022_09310 [Paenibacillus hunanensis]
MFFHIKELQYTAKPDKPDPVYARKLQEVLGGQYGEMSVPRRSVTWKCWQR